MAHCVIPDLALWHKSENGFAIKVVDKFIPVAIQTAEFQLHISNLNAYWL